MLENWAEDARRQGLRKTPGARVTDTDVALESWMLEEVETLFPDDGVIAEEAGRVRCADHEFVWIVDPLDGTNNMPSASRASPFRWGSSGEGSPMRERSTIQTPA